MMWIIFVINKKCHERIAGTLDLVENDVNTLYEDLEPPVGIVFIIHYIDK